MLAVHTVAPSPPDEDAPPDEDPLLPDDDDAPPDEDPLLPDDDDAPPDEDPLLPDDDDAPPDEDPLLEPPEDEPLEDDICPSGNPVLPSAAPASSAPLLPAPPFPHAFAQQRRKPTETGNRCRMACPLLSRRLGGRWWLNYFRGRSSMPNVVGHSVLALLASPACHPHAHAGQSEPAPAASATSLSSSAVVPAAIWSSAPSAASSTSAPIPTVTTDWCLPSW
jgi:hypothetical protein